MATKDESSGAGRPKAAKKKAVKKKAVKKKAVARKKLDEVTHPLVDSGDETSVELETRNEPSLRSESSIPSVSAIQETIATRTTRSVRSRDITVFLRQLIMMLEAGTPILKALKSLSHRGERPAIRNLVTGIAEYVEAGNPLWQAFAREGKHFSSIYVNLIKAAEASGSLTVVLRRLVSYREKREMLRRNLIVALIYPASVALVAYLIIWALATFLIPVFREMFASFDLPLSGFTKFVMNAASLIGGWYSFLFVFIAIAGIWALYSLWFVQSPLRRVMVDRLKLRLPVIGPLTQAGVVAEFTRTFAMLQRSGVLMMSTLELCRNSMSNRAFAECVQDMRDSVERGDGLEAPLRAAERNRLIPGVVVDMLITGEETGSMDNIADQIADSYEEEVEILVAGLKEAIQPIMVIGIGFAVGGIVIAMFLPLVTMIESLATSSM